MSPRLRKSTGRAPGEREGRRIPFEKAMLCKPSGAVAACRGALQSQKTNWRPQWQPDKSTKVCSTCSKTFNVLHRRHHCRHCGRVICGSCGKKKYRVVLLKYGYHDPVRVCVSCHELCTQSEEMMAAISANGYVAVEALLDAGADPNFSTVVFTPFMHAASKGHTKLMQLLMERGADIQYAVPQLDSRINIECENCHRQITAEFNSLHSYQCPGCWQFTFEFSEAHANVGMTAMHASAAKGQSKAVQWLLQHGVDVNTQTMLGDTPLMVSVMGGHKDTVQHLMENGSNVRLCNVDKDTALHKAVAEGLQKIVMLLCEAGASITAKNRQGQTPVQIADEKGDTLVIDMLSRYGAKEASLAPEGSFGYTKWQTNGQAGDGEEGEHSAGRSGHHGAAGAATTSAGNAKLGSIQSTSGSDVNGAEEGEGVRRLSLGDWEVRAGAPAGAEDSSESHGLGGTRKSDSKPFQWDTSLPKLADRKILNMLVN